MHTINIDPKPKVRKPRMSQTGRIREVRIDDQDSKNGEDNVET